MSIYDQITNEIKQAYYAHNFSNDGQRFVAWYLRNIHLCSMDETKYNITDGANDKQIDAVYIDEDNSAIYIIQGKFIGAPLVDAEPLREVLSSWAQLKNLIKLQENCNEKLQQKLSEVSVALEDDYEIIFELITTAQLTPAAQHDLAIFQETIAKPDDLTCSINMIDEEELKRRYDLALEKDNPSLKHKIQLEPGKYIQMEIAGTEAIMAAIQLKDCITFPGIKDGTLFRKNVRQSLGLNNPVNKAIRSTIYSDKYRDFFFFHNGITAICNHMHLSEDGVLQLNGLSVVNGCQSLNTILSCSERVKQIPDAFIMFRFYEIPQIERADRISISTNSQSVVKPRDLRSNDKRVLNLKHSFEQAFPNGYFISKRGEIAPPSKDRTTILDLSDLGKYLISWHSQRPNIAYSETKIFDKYFEQLFKRDYSPNDAQSLNFWMQEIMKCWTSENILGLNETLLAMKAYAPYHQLYAVSMCYSIVSNLPEMVPSPKASWDQAVAKNQIEQIVKIAGSCLNTALEAAANEPQPANRVFSPQNWVKAKACLSGINAAIRQYFSMLPTLPMPGAKELSLQLKNTLTLPRDSFDYRWAAD